MVYIISIEDAKRIDEGSAIVGIVSEVSVEGAPHSLSFDMHRKTAYALVCTDIGHERVIEAAERWAEFECKDRKAVRVTVVLREGWREVIMRRHGTMPFSEWEIEGALEWDRDHQAQLHGHMMPAAEFPEVSREERNALALRLEVEGMEETVRQFEVLKAQLDGAKATVRRLEELIDGMELKISDKIRGLRDR